jgi:hypothetical protein
VKILQSSPSPQDRWRLARSDPSSAVPVASHGPLDRRRCACDRRPRLRHVNAVAVVIVVGMRRPCGLPSAPRRPGPAMREPANRDVAARPDGGGRPIPAQLERPGSSCSGREARPRSRRESGGHDACRKDGLEESVHGRRPGLADRGTPITDGRGIARPQGAERATRPRAHSSSRTPRPRSPPRDELCGSLSA